MRISPRISGWVLAILTISPLSHHHFIGELAGFFLQYAVEHNCEHLAPLPDSTKPHCWALCTRYRFQCAHQDPSRALIIHGITSPLRSPSTCRKFCSIGNTAACTNFTKKISERSRQLNAHSREYNLAISSNRYKDSMM